MSERNDQTARVEWLGCTDGRKNCHGQQLARAASFCHEVPVALVLRRHGKHELVHRDHARTDLKAVELRKPGQKSVIETARELARRLKSGQAKSLNDLSRQVHLTRHKCRRLLQLLNLDASIQNYLTKSGDQDGRMSIGYLQRLARVGPGSDQVRDFRAMCSRGGTNSARK